MRDFFARQDHARRSTARLLAVFAVAGLVTILTTAAVFAALVAVLAVAYLNVTTNIEMDREYLMSVLWSRFWLALAVTSVAVVGVAVYRTLQFVEGGGRELAKQLGATRVWSDATDPRQRQLINIVDELSVVTGLTAPNVFVLEHDHGINAFAAGMHPKDTVVGVTQGALQCLDRSQLQGVLAHEFSHIQNRDVRLNLYTMGALEGIEVIASAAMYLTRIGMSPRTKAAPLALVFGLILWPIGRVGALFGLVIRMAMNRQREFLADAAAVQFTRNPEGLCSALKLIADHEHTGQVASGTAERASHLFFAEAKLHRWNLLSSHPSLQERIRRLESLGEGPYGDLSAAITAGARAANDQLAGTGGTKVR
jgi:Zn-dependent protease with chaperone function